MGGCGGRAGGRAPQPDGITTACHASHSLPDSVLTSIFQRVTNFGKTRTARGAQITSVEEAKLEVSKRALRESALASNTLFRAQRTHVSPSLDPIDRAITLSLHQEECDRSTPLPLLTQHERLKRQLAKVLKVSSNTS